MFKKKLAFAKQEIFIAITFFIVALIVSIFFYIYLNNFHCNNLKKYLVTIARTASLDINGDDLDEIHEPEDMDKLVFKNLVSYLKKVKNNNDDIEYAYIMRKTDDSDILEFIADADSLTPKEELDENDNGIVDPEEELSLPGDEYDISDAPAMEEAFLTPTADKDITVDQWGKLISGYAPVYDKNNEVVAILGVDLKAEDYYSLQKRTDFGLFIFIFLFSSCFLVAFILLRQHKKELSSLKELDKQKSDFISLASHQLRTPLSASKWCINMLQDGEFGELDKDHKKALNNLCNVNQKMVNLVNDLLKIFQLDTKKVKANFKKINFKKIISEILEEVNYLITEKNIKFIYEIDENITDFKTDNDLLKEVLLNLLINSIKYSSKDKEILLKIYIDDKKIFFRLEDSGYGIPKKEQIRIFTKFFRASNALKNEPNGTGLGLYFVKKVIDLLGGKINFISNETKGSTFYFYLPYNN